MKTELQPKPKLELGSIARAFCAPLSYEGFLIQPADVMFVRPYPMSRPNPLGCSVLFAGGDSIILSNTSSSTVNAHIQAALANCRILLNDLIEKLP